jgi:uncharacterized membrane protein
MCIGMLAFWGAVIWGIWYVVTHAVPRSELRPPEISAEGILDERLARGEIDTDEYRRLRDTIRTTAIPAGNGRSPASTGAQQ